MAVPKTYLYCDILPATSKGTSYYYIADFKVNPGDIVIYQSGAKEKVGLVLYVGEYSEEKAPYPPELTKHIKRIFGNNEADYLVKEKKKSEEEKAIRFKSKELLEKLSIKRALINNSVCKDSIVEGKDRIRRIVEAIPERNEMLSEIISDLSDGIVVSADGKTVIEYKRVKKKGNTVIRIPSGVEKIEDNAFLRVNIDELYLPKELRNIGLYTIYNEGGAGPYPKNITSIHVEEGNEHFYADEFGFYSVENKMKKLLLFTKRDLTSFTVPKDVVAFSEYAFAHCTNLKQIILSDGMEVFDENALPSNTQVEEVFVSKTVKKLQIKSKVGWSIPWNTVSSYRFDETSEHFFRDEDSIYEVLDDGTYKMIVNLYDGKGKVLFLEGTSIIGAHAFEGHNNLTTIEFPKSIRVIEKNAFSQTALKTVIIPETVQRVESGAFARCENLKKVQLSPNLASIAEDAFQQCYSLERITTDGGEKGFSYENGIIKKLPAIIHKQVSSSESVLFEWMRGKVFVHTGFSDEEEREFENTVISNGGTIKSSTVLTTDYLVYNADYGHETTKLKRAKELQKQGKDIQILSMTDWKKLLRSQQGGQYEEKQDNTQKDDVISVPQKKPAITKKYVFASFVRTIVDIIKEESVSSKDRARDKAEYDQKNRVLSITTAFDQKSKLADIVKERVSCAESLKENDQVRVIIKKDVWEIKSLAGQSLGELGWLMARRALPYLNCFSIKSCCIASITPKSMRKAGCKYALGSVKLEIVEKTSSTDMSEEDLITMNNYAYYTDEKEAHLMQWIGPSSVETVVIPAYVEGKPVVSIEPGLFSEDAWTGVGMGYGSRVDTIIISEGIKRLGTNTITGINNLKKVVFPASLEYISPRVFSGEDDEFTDLYLDKETVYVAPAGSYAEKFLKGYQPDHYDVKSLFVVNEVATDSDSDRKMVAAFDYEPSEKGLLLRFKKSYMLEGFKEQKVIVPNTVNGEPVRILDIMGIPNFVEELVIPTNVSHIENVSCDVIFYENGHSLRKIEIANENCSFWSDGFAVYSKDKKRLIRFLSYCADNYTVPEGTEILSEFSFAEMKNLETLVLPDSIKTIESHAFSECDKLSDIQGMDRVLEVGEEIFAGTGWKSGRTIPFEHCTSILRIGSTLMKYNKLSEKEITIPEGITVIGDRAFGGEFEDDQVEKINLPASVKEIGKYAFFARRKLKEIQIPEGVREIQAGTFDNCDQLERIIIPSSIEKIDLGAFPTAAHFEGRKCALRAIEVDPNNQHYCSVNGMLLTKDRSVLLYIPWILQNNKFDFPDGILTIGKNLCYNNTVLKELIIPKSVKVIGEYAFAQCKCLEKIVLPEGLETIEKNAFSNCTLINHIEFPKSLKRIGDAAFYKNGLKNILLYENIEHIGSVAFGETPVKKVTLPKSVVTVGQCAFRGIPEIEVYDTIDPDAEDAYAKIDSLNGEPNSLVGYIGMNPKNTMFNHQWIGYTITVRSAETDEIKYKVWMGADGSQRQYYCFLSSAWGHNATFAFKKMDEFFPKIRGTDHKLQVAKYRLEYPYELSEAAKSKYEAYIKRYS